MTDTAQDWTGVEDMQDNDMGLDADECRWMMHLPPLRQNPQPKPTNDPR